MCLKKKKKLWLNFYSATVRTEFSIFLIEHKKFGSRLSMDGIK